MKHNKMISNSCSSPIEYNALAERYEALSSLNKLLHECKDINHFYKAVHEVIISLMTANNFTIALCDRTFETIEYVYQVNERYCLHNRESLISDTKGTLEFYLIKQAEALALTRYDIQKLFEQKEITYHEDELTDWLGVPFIEQGIVVGMVCLQNYHEENQNIEQDLDLLHFIAQQINLAIARFQDQDQLKRAVDARTRELMQQIRERERSELLQESLFKISELSNESNIDINKFYTQVHNIVGQLINAKNFYIANYNVEKDTLDFDFILDQYLEYHEQCYKKHSSIDYYSSLILKEKNTILLNDKELNKLNNKYSLCQTYKDIKSWLGVPLMINGEIIGVMAILSYHANIVYSEQDAQLLNFVARHISSAIKRREHIEFERQSHELLEQKVRLRTQALQEEIKQRHKAEEKLTYAASHDSLTGLANRSVFLDLLNHAIACKQRKPNFQFALLFIDLDRFKVVNDSLGHHAGDILLKNVANELKNITRSKDTVARIGGDEFVILIEDLNGTSEAFYVADRITKLLDEPIIIENTPVFIGTSIGVLFSDERYVSADVMLRDADTAMYQAKAKGKGRFEVFDTSMQLKVENALTLEADIREGIKLSQFIPYFQPIVRLHDESIVGFEALARWVSPKRGFVCPNDFIDMAEDTGLILKLDLLILEKSCLALKELHNRSNKTFYVSCNLYCEHFFNPKLPELIADILERVDIDPSELRIELTERALLDNKLVVLENMKALKKIGVKILLDDFGTGYSSLSYLHQFPIDILKIDRSFISNIQTEGKHKAIIKTIIDLAANLNMSTVGEGIEYEADANLLNDMECRYGQGFFFAKPLPIDDVILTLTGK